MTEPHRPGRRASPWSPGWPLGWPLGWALLWGLCVAVGLALWGLRGQVTALDRLDQWSLDLQFQARGPISPGVAPQVLLVLLDEPSWRRLGGRVPDRAQLGQAVRQLSEAGAKAIALDLLLLDGGTADEPANASLAAAMRESGRIFLPFALPDEAAPAAGSGPSGPSTAVLAQALLGYDDEAALERSEARVYLARQLLAPPPSLAEAAAGLGHVSARSDSDGSLRFDLPLLRWQGEVYPSLALRLATSAREADWKAVRARFGEAVQAPGLVQPLDVLSRAWVNYYGPSGSFAALSLADVLDGRIDPARVQGRVVIVGVSALAAGDHLPTPFDASLPGVERLATVTDNLLTGRGLVKPDWGAAAELLALLLLPLLACVGIARWSAARALLAWSVVVALALVAAQWAFVERHWFFSVMPPLLAGLLAVLAASALRSSREQQRRRAALEALVESEARYALAAQGANDGLWDWDLRRDEVHFSPRWFTLMGQDPGATTMAAWTAPLDDSGRREFEEELQAHLRGQSRQFHQVLHFQQGGQERWLLARGMAQREAGQPVRMAGSLTDISESQRQQRQISHDALHDRLTGLPNRVLLREQLGQVLAANPAPQVGVLVLGLDGFRTINETQGTLVGDAVLTELAQRLRAACFGLTTVARLGADQFALLLSDQAGAADQVRVVQQALAEPFQARSGSPVRLTAGIGWAERRHGPAQVDELVAAAEGALARAKALGPGQVHEFDPAEQLVEQSRRGMREAIAAALQAGDQFELHYQPFVRLSDRALLGFEALIRWRHPTKGWVMPGDFIPVAEHSGQIEAIGRWTLLEAAAQLRRWHAQGFTGEIAVNLSGVQIEHDLALLADARDVLAALGDVPPHQLKLEVTESMAMANPQNTAETLQQLSRMGFKLSIDDFGTGYSSLAYLHRFPFDTLKVDRSFVIRLGQGREAQEIVRTIVGLALALGKQTLAEGVEDEAQAAQLEQLGVQVGQGWLFAKALPAGQAEGLIAAGRLQPKP